MTAQPASELPPLPLPEDEVKCFPYENGCLVTCNAGDDYYNADDMRAYGLACIAALRAEALAQDGWVRTSESTSRCCCWRSGPRRAG